ncbi:MAG: helix-turn-helix transcriptional regulator [Elainellaceae cyanobacterium]
MGDSPLKRLREELGLSQEGLARSIGTSARTISRWEAGDSVPTFTVVQMKALDELLRENGRLLSDLPDSFGPVDG